MVPTVRLCEGNRAPAGVRYPPKQEAAGSVGDLWGFRVWPRRAARATVVPMLISGQAYGCRARCSASMLAAIGA